MYKILIAEDNSSDVFLIQYALKDHGVDAEFIVISDGEEALEYIDHLGSDPGKSVDLILLDLHLPKRDGAELMAHLRSRAASSQIPFIALSSSVSPQDKNTAEENGAIHYFRKPPSLDEFLVLGEIVKQVLSGASRKDSLPV